LEASPYSLPGGAMLVLIGARVWGWWIFLFPFPSSLLTPLKITA